MDIPIAGAIVVAVVTAGLTTLLNYLATRLLDRQRHTVARQERLEQWRFKASEDYLRSAIKAFRANETAAKWVSARANQDIPAKVDQGRLAREERWAAFTVLKMACAPGLHEWILTNYSPAEERMELTFQKTCEEDGSDYAPFFEAANAWRVALDALTDHLRGEIRKTND
jgi:hypothetical protein